MRTDIQRHDHRLHAVNCTLYGQELKNRRLVQGDVVNVNYYFKFIAYISVLQAFFDTQVNISTTTFEWLKGR